MMIQNSRAFQNDSNSTNETMAKPFSGAGGFPHFAAISARWSAVNFSRCSCKTQEGQKTHQKNASEHLGEKFTGGCHISTWLDTANSTRKHLNQA